MVLREHDDPLNQSKGIMGPLENSTGVQNNRGRLRQRFDLIRKLGQGTYGKVQLGIDKETGQEVAIKTIKKSKIETEADLIRIRREIQIMSSVRHPNIIHIYEVFENREKMVLVMEYAAGGELYDYLNERKVLKEDEARRIFRQIASAVYYCHKHKICHRDLKLENILLDEATNAKIADFGLSNVFDNTHLLKTFCGSPLYASPEIVRGTPYCGPEVDCWSLGVLLYTLVYGAMPFDGSNFKRLVKQISNGDYYEPKKIAEASPLIKLMLTVDPIKRASIKDVCSNAWINHGFDKPCLAIAEELANATPVRLDILLSLSSPITANNVVIEKHGDEGEPQIPESSKAKSEAKAKTKMKRAAGVTNLEEESMEPPSGSKPKTPSSAKKQVVKKKSKSSPLLELIVDVEEENEHDVGEEGTLSEISEIQTLAEGESDIKLDKALKSKDKLPLKSVPTVEKTTKEQPEIKFQPPKNVEPKVETTKKEPEVEVPQTLKNTEAKVETVKTTGSNKPEATTTVADDKVKVKSPIKKPVQKKVNNEVAAKGAEPEVNSTQIEKPVEPTPAETPKQTKEKKESVPPPEKPTTKPPAEEAVSPSSQAVTKDKNTEPEKTTVKPKPVETPNLNKSEENKAGGVNENKEEAAKTAKSQKDASPPKTTTKAVKLKQRSDSTNSENTSPTRIERRNSKVISQKTAELIQNLETKTSTSADAKGKKFVFPSLRVSDAKSKFETGSKSQSNEIKPVEKEKKRIIGDDAKPKLKVKSTSPIPQKETATTVKNGPVQIPKNESDKISGTNAVSPSTTNPPSELPKDTSSKPANVTPDMLKTNETAEPNIAMKVEALVAEVKSPRRSRSPRKPESEKASEEPVVKPVPTPVKEPVKPSTTPVKEVTPKAISTQEQGQKKDSTPIVSESVAFNSTPTFVKSNVVAGKPVVQDVGPTSENVAIAPKEKLLQRVPSQSKEQAAKKIGSVIQKIVSSESVDKCMDNRKNSIPGPSKMDAKPASFRTEIQNFVMAPDSSPQAGPKAQRTEVTFPVAAASSQERIIPIKLIDEFSNGSANVSRNSSGANTSRSNLQRMDSGKTSLSFSRQDSSETESSIGPAPPKCEALKKSPREFIIPIKMESGHVVTPKEEVLNSESSVTEDNFRLDSRLRSGRFGRQKRFNSILSDSGDGDDPISASVSAASSRRSSAASTAASHIRSLSQGDEPQTPSTPVGTFKGFKHKIPLDRSDSCSSADEDEEDAFEVLTAESLFTSLLDRVRNLTKRLNRESSTGPGWTSGSESPAYGLWGSTTPLQEFMTRAPTETRHFISPTPGSYSTARSYSREPSVTVTITTGPGWRQSLSREMSGESESCSEAQSAGSLNQGRNYSSLRNSKDTPEMTGLRAINTRRRFQSPLTYNSQISEPNTTTSYTPSRPFYGRTVSNTDYSSPSTLPLRRPIRTYDRSFTERELLPNSSASNTSSVNSSGHGIDHRYGRSSSVVSSGLDSPSLGFPRYRPFNRMASTPDPESRYSSVLEAERPGQIENATNGWVGGATSSSTRTAAAKLTTQEKMNNYQNYYQNLSKHPTRRLDVLNPAANPGLSSRPVTMYETSFVDHNQGNVSADASRNEILGIAASLRDSVYTNQSNRPSTSTNMASSSSPFNGRGGSTSNEYGSGTNDTPGILSSESGGEGSRNFASTYTTGQSCLGNSVNFTRPRPDLGVRQSRPYSVSSFGEKPPSITPSFQPPTPPPTTYVAGVLPTEYTNGPTAPNRPLSPKSELSFVQSESIRLNSPPPMDDRAQMQTPTPKLKRDVRATSVEKITRFLERKSKPREIPPEGRNTPFCTENETADANKASERSSVSPEKKVKPPNASKLTKPKFIQSLEKKWEKFTNKTEENPLSSCPSSPCPPEELNNGSDNSDESVTTPNESQLLQRALSPEKKPKSKFGANTVNFMLGKFRKIEEGTNAKGVKNNTTGKPPIGFPGLVGRRIQTPYAGARSDSVLLQNQVVRPNLHLSITPRTEPVAPVTLPSPQNPKLPSTIAVKSENPVTVCPPEKPLESPAGSEKVLRRPVSLGIFSGDMSKSTSFIPRFQQRGKNEEEVPARLSIANVEKSQNSLKPEGDAEEDPTTPTSVSDSFDSVSVCSEKTEVSLKSSALDDVESLSDRIFRKSFYSRFNSLDRKKPTTASGSAATLRSNNTLRSATTCAANAPEQQPSASFLPRINKYNPNPLFNELITDEFKLNSAKKNDYSRRVTSKLSKLLSEIDTDIKSCTNNNNDLIDTPKDNSTDVKAEK